MSGRKPRFLRAGLWIALAVAAVVLAALLLLPKRTGMIDEAGERLAPVLRSLDEAVGGGGEATGPSSAAPDHEDAIRGPENRAPAGAEAGRVEVVGGFTVLALGPEIQKRSGLRTERLEPVTFAPEIAAFGRVLDMQPLLAERSRYTAARAQADVSRATLSAAKAEYDRLAALHRAEGDIATKRIQQAQAQWKEAQAELRRYESQAASVRDETRQQWGSVLTGWALDGPSPEFERLIKNEDALLLVTLPPERSLPPDTETVQVARNGVRADAVPASYVAPSPIADPIVQGETYFFRTDARGLRAGMRLDVWVNEPKSAALGVIVPQSAVVWALGQAWAYIQIDNTHFVRRPVSTDVQAPGGWFVKDTVKPGDHIVIAGAQMLYSEESRSQFQEEGAD